MSKSVNNILYHINKYSYSSEYTEIMNRRTEGKYPNITLHRYIIVRYPILARGKICHDLAWVCWLLKMAITSLFLIISHDTLRKLTICWVIPSAQQLYWIIYRDVGICEISSRLVELSGQNIRLEDCETNFIFAWVLKFAMAQILNRYIQSLDPSHFMPLCTLAD